MAATPETLDAAEWEARERTLRERAEFVELLGYVSVAANEAADVGTALGQLLERVCAHHGLVVGHALVVEPSGGLCSRGIWYLDDPASSRSGWRLSG
jgi:hypothetical protein